MRKKSGHIPTGVIKKSNPIRFRYFRELSKLFPNRRNIMTPNGYFHIYGIIRANSTSSSYHIEFRSKGKKLMVLLHGIKMPENGLEGVPHIYKEESDLVSGTISLCLFRNKPNRCEFTFGDDPQETIIPWTREWIYFYELYLMTGKWYGNGEHPQETRGKSHKNR